MSSQIKIGDLVTEKHSNHNIFARVIDVFNPDPQNNPNWYAKIEYYLKGKKMTTTLPLYRLTK